LVLIRPFENGDNVAMLDIDKICTQGNETLAMGVDKSPNIIARYKLYDNWKVLVAQEDGKIAGWTGWTVKKNPVNDEKFVYLVEVMVHPEFRRKGVATKLILQAEKSVREIGSDHIYCGIYEPNNASKCLFTKLGYSNKRDLKICALSVFKKVSIAQQYKIERINKNEIREVVKLINDYYSGRAQFIPYTSETFESNINKIT